MSDIIRLLPDSVANQIAAGEVIQRPASAVKELLENAIDAGSTEINLIIRDAGKTLIHIVDNGCGMSQADARMSFERHATSKISKADDLYAIRTLGFRGEALASIAAIAQVELKTRLHDDELGTCLQVEGTKVTRQSACQASPGTSIQVKNLFFNVPARRNFLKSNTSELKHIIDEFFRVALVYHDIKFTLHSNDQLLHQLNPSNLKQRIISLYGNNYKERLIDVEHHSSEINLKGFIGKPEFARKTRGEQFFFVNGRYIRHPYLHHSVENAFQELLPKDSFPTYFIYMEADPSTIDINIHPTKTEVNFQDSKIIYATLRSAIRQALGKHHIIPSIDFDVEQSLDFNPLNKERAIINPFNREQSEYNPFESKNIPSITPSRRRQQRINIENWEQLYRVDQEVKQEQDKNRKDVQQEFDQEASEYEQSGQTLLQLRNTHIVIQARSGLMVIDQHRAHQRILYEKFLDQLKIEEQSSQQELFPENITFSSSDSTLVEDLLDEFKILGFSLNKLGKNTFVVNGTPAGWKDHDIQGLFDRMLDNYKKNLIDLDIDKKINLARSMAVNMALKSGKKLYLEEMMNLINSLFACKVPEITPDGDRVFTIIDHEEIIQRLND